jgi:hypothetical protein
LVIGRASSRLPWFIGHNACRPEVVAGFLAGVVDLTDWAADQPPFEPELDVTRTDRIGVLATEQFAEGAFDP